MIILYVVVGIPGVESQDPFFKEPAFVHVLFACALMMGLGDSSINVVLPSEIGETFSGPRSSAGFGNFRSVHYSLKKLHTSMQSVSLGIVSIRMLLSTGCALYYFSESMTISFVAKVIFVCGLASVACLLFFVHTVETKIEKQRHAHTKTQSASPS